jgi:beta-lactamase class A
MSAATDSAVDRIAAAFAAIGLRGRLHAVELDSGREVAVGADEPVVLASVFKVALVTALYRRHEAGELDVAQQVEVAAAQAGTAARSAGATGLAAMQDPARLSLRDLAYLAIAVSDNAAADVLFDAVGDAAVAALLDDLGLTATRIPQRCRDMADALVADTAAAGVDDVQSRLLADPRLLDALSVRDPGRTNASTAREMTALLAAIWQDRAAGPDGCEAVRRLMRLQVWPHRLASGFPDEGYAVAGKTGTLPGIRNEIGVVAHPHGSRVAVAVFTSAGSPAASLPQADRVIGTAARIAVDALRAA